MSLRRKLRRSVKRPPAGLPSYCCVCLSAAVRWCVRQTIDGVCLECAARMDLAPEQWLTWKEAERMLLVGHIMDT